jgi:hypothetical protein
MLPNSTEQAITIAGIPQSIIECVKQICVVMLESPPKGVTIPYRPKPSSSPVIFAGGQVRKFLLVGYIEQIIFEMSFASSTPNHSACLLKPVLWPQFDLLFCCCCCFLVLEKPLNAKPLI